MRFDACWTKAISHARKLLSRRILAVVFAKTGCNKEYVLAWPEHAGTLSECNMPWHVLVHHTRADNHSVSPPHVITNVQHIFPCVRIKGCSDLEYLSCCELTGTALTHYSPIINKFIGMRQTNKLDDTDGNKPLLIREIFTAKGSKGGILHGPYWHRPWRGVHLPWPNIWYLFINAAEPATRSLFSAL